MNNDLTATNRKRYSQKKFTAKYRPWEPKLSIAAGDTRFEAMKMERFIKRKKSRRFIEQLIEAKDDEEQIVQLV